ncbi:hypothetical protein tinsulaeT_20490 [Thalassotalea insulae]|uniref:Cytochrome oxidase biogenesis cluster protein n=1 Tax=Thalassotalea insulae TaxID=2056778 RepID=A0ABQ6GTP2_9GAMM|nr:hypothetical protein [Thalassotalea insulae]GLX78709.1 hypothetical protein tinsulaeT_20490 [Thalassotalea insulae]
MSSQLAKSRRNLLLVLGVFIIPVILAKLALDQHWFNYGVTNQGHLAEQQITLKEMGLAHEKFNQQWLLLYRIPDNCQQFCQQLSLAINNTYTLLGKELPRVTPVALHQVAPSHLPSESLRHHKWLTLALTDLAKPHLASGQLVIVDPMGNLVMSYDVPESEQQLNQYSKAILADMKKLLKYSRIG